MNKTFSAPYGEMIDKINIDTVYSIVLKKGGSTHNIVVKEKGEQNLIANVALERLMYMFDKKNQPKCEFGFCENDQQLERKVENNKEINIIEVSRAFILIPRIVIIPYDNIGLIEEAPFPYIESTNSIGTEIKVEDDMIINNFPIFKPYYSEEVGGFYQSPVLVKNSTLKFPFQLVKGGDKSKNSESKGV
jgi:hypothetical protein